jgi:3-(3-hydroxy-phenyl)propionate hydroxylase
MTAALVLGAKGHTVTLLEAGADLSTVSRASTVHASTLELLDDLGVAWDVIHAGYIVRELQYRDRATGVIAEFTFDDIADFTRFPVRMQTDQSQITRIIRRRIETTLPNVSIVYDSEVTGVSQTDSGVEVTAVTGGEPTTYRAGYAIGADGAHSAVRRSLGIPLEGDQYEYAQLMILTPFDVLAAMPELKAISYVFDEKEPCALMTLPGHSRLVFHLAPGEDEDVAKLPANLQRRMRGFLPPIDGDYPVLDALTYRTHRRAAATMRAGRVFLAGDAAHLNSPSGGMGMNSGIHDAYLLGRTLAGVLAGNVGDIALDAYSSVRLAAAIGYVQFRSDTNVRNSRAVDTRERAWRAERLRTAAATRQSRREYLLRAAMFDSVPRVTW